MSSPDENNGHPIAPVAPTVAPQIQPPVSLDLTSNTNLVDKWKLWKQTWENYSIIAQLNKQPSAYRLALFLHSIGTESLKIYNSFDYGDDEDKSLLETVIKKFGDHFIGASNETYERYLFNKRVQDSDETVDSYVTALRNLAQSCNFCKCLHDSLIRDQIVIGIRDNATRKRLLQERQLTLSKAIDTCRGAEATASQLKTIGGQQEAPVHKVKTRPKPKLSYMKRDRKQSDKPESKVECKFCGYTHVPEKLKCPAWGKTCKSCNGRNHFAKKCSKAQKTHNLCDVNQSSDSEPEWVSHVKVHAVNSSDKEAHAEICRNDN